MKVNISVISNDAGATEYLASLIQSQSSNINWNVFALVNSPASKIFKRLEIPFSTINKVEELYEKFNTKTTDIFMYGTGWQENFSKIIKETCIKNKIKSIGLIDHWITYEDRFYKDALPNFIMIMDDNAYKLAKDTFPEKVGILQVKNYFLEQVKSSFTLIQNKSFLSVVFISEPTSIIAKNNFQDENAYGFTEYSAVEDLLQKFDSLIIRLHPSDEINKYNYIVEKYYDKNITIIKPYEEELIETLSKSKLTIGFDGMALYISYVLGIKTISYMPNNERELTIPIPKRYLLRDINDLHKVKFETLDFDDLQGNAKDFSKVIHHILEGN